MVSDKIVDERCQDKSGKYQDCAFLCRSLLIFIRGLTVGVRLLSQMKGTRLRAQMLYWNRVYFEGCDEENLVISYLAGLMVAPTSRLLYTLCR